MRDLFAAAVALLGAAPVAAGMSSNLVIAFQGRPSVSVVLRQDAEFVAVPVSISSERKDPSERFAEIQRALQALVDKAGSTSQVIVRQGPVSLSGRRGSSFSLGSSSYQAPSRAQLDLMMELNGRSVFTCASQILQLVADLKPPGEARYEVGEVQLALSDPETRRPQLLQAIAADVARTRQLLGGAIKVIVSGLESPVLVRQVSDREVELFIDYSVAMDLDPGTEAKKR